MDNQTRRVGKVVSATKEDIKMAINKLDVIDHNSCDEKTMHLIDEAIDCLEMAQRFLERIDLSQYKPDFNGEGIILKH